MFLYNEENTKTYAYWGLNIIFRKTEYLTSGYKKHPIIQGKRINNVIHYKNLRLESQLQIEINIKKE